jgi:hypothetical protein
MLLDVVLFGVFPQYVAVLGGSLIIVAALLVSRSRIAASYLQASETRQVSPSPFRPYNQVLVSQRCPWFDRQHVKTWVLLTTAGRETCSDL